jgi:hypothetical protein
MRARAWGTGVLLFVGCAGETEPEAPPLPFEDLPTAFGEAECANLRCDPFHERAAQPRDCAEYRANVYRSAAYALLKEAVSSGRIHYDPVAARRCFDERVADGCEEELRHRRPSCDDTFKGTVRLGEPCEVSEECEGLAACPFDPLTCSGTCVELMGEGQGRCWAHTDCDDGLLCVDQHCTVPLEEGDDCSGGWCPTRLSCDENDVCSDPEPRKHSLGQTCDLYDLFSCEDELVCMLEGDPDGLMGRCRHRLESGAACYLSNREPCPEGEVCQGLDSIDQSIAGVCVALPEAGETCVNSQTSPWCAVDFHCGSETCEPMQDLGGPCTESQDCWSFNCAEGTCIPHRVCAPE